MSRVETQVVGQTRSIVREIVQEKDQGRDFAKQAAIVVAASLFVALCARISVPLPGTPVPLTLQNFGVLAVGLLLGSRRGFAALTLYLAEGALGLPVFSMGAGIAYLLGPTGGFLLAYPIVAFVAGYIYEQSSKHSSTNSSTKVSGRFVWAVLASFAAELVLFAGGLSWLAILTHSVSLAIKFGLYWFVFAEIIKILMAAGVATRWQQWRSSQE
jgi:biotin transport system substrate-specific component